MTSSQSKAALDVILDGIDAARALVILVDDNGEIETADKNLGAENVMMVCFSLAVRIAEQRKAERNDVPEVPRQRQKPLIYLPPDLQRNLDSL